VAAQIDKEILDYLETLSSDPTVVGLLEVCVGRVLNKAKNSKRNWREAAMAHDLRHVVDWLDVALLHEEEWLANTDAEGRPRKLLKFADIEQVYKEANRALVKRAQMTPEIKIETDDEELVAKLSGGYYVVNLLNARALDYESSIMQHCVGLGSYDAPLLSGRTAILSLRDPHNKPHVTIEIDVKANSIVQIRGKQNAKPRGDYQRMVREFIATRDYDAIWRPADVGLIADSLGKLHDIERLPPGLSITGSLSVSDSGLTSLPEGLEISGDLILLNSMVEELPSGLRVRGSLRAAHSRLKALPARHGIGRDIDLSHSAVSALPDGLVVEGDLTISDTSIARLPEDLLVIGSLAAERIDLKVFPRGVCVGQTLNLSNSGVREFEADSIYVGGNLILNACGRMRLPRSVAVESSMFVEETSVMSGGARLDIGGNIFCASSDILDRERNITVRGRYIKHKRCRPVDLRTVRRIAEERA
jgi:hypothetical protein